MNSKKFKIILIILILNFLNSFSFSVENLILAKVGNKTVSSYDLKNKIRTTLILSNQEINQINIDKIKRLSLSSLINFKIKEIETSKYNIQVEQNKVLKQLNDISSNNIQGLKQKFKINNLNYEIFVKELETEIKWQNLILSLYSKNVKIDDKEVEKDVKKFLTENSSIQQFKLAEIEILDEGTNSQQALDKELRDFINSSNFAEAAKKFSISPTANTGGDLGWIDSVSLSKEMLLIIENLKIGEISKPIKKSNTISFYKLNDIRNIDNKIDLELIRNKITNRKKIDLFKMYSNSHLSKKKNNIFINIK